jgi:hypothetical protein
MRARHPGDGRHGPLPVLRERPCCDGHGSEYFDRAQTEEIARDFRTPGALDRTDVAVMAFAEKVATDANKVAPEDTTTSAPMA